MGKQQIISQTNLYNKFTGLRMKKISALTLLLIWLLFMIGMFAIMISATSFLNTSFRILAGILFIVCIYKGAQEKYLFNPYFLFAITPLTLLIYFESISYYYLYDLSTMTWGIALWNMFMFVLGLSIVENRNASKSSLASTNIDGKRELTFHAKVLLLLGLLPTLYGIIMGYQVLLTGNLLAMNEYVTIMPLTSVFMFFKFPAIACAIKSKQKSTIVLVIVACVLSAFMNFNKTELAFLLITVIVTISKFSYNSRKTNVTLFFLMAISAFVLLWAFSFYDNMRMGYDSATYYMSQDRINPVLPKNLVLPYLYATTPWTNLQFVMETQATHTYGLWVLKPILGYLQLERLFSSQYELTASSSFNTYTYIAILFKDFGIIGSGIVSLLLGLMQKKIYVTFRTSASPLMTVIYALNALALIEMFFTNHYFGQSYPFTIIIIMYLYRIIFVTKELKRDKR